jgi:hypothetical protein
MRNQGTYTDFSDRNAIAQARLNNLEKDLGMTGVQFNTTVSMFVNSLPESTLTPCPTSTPVPLPRLVEVFAKFYTVSLSATC